MNAFTRRASIPARSRGVRFAVALSLAAGLADVSVALLRTPRDFEGFAALMPPLLATAVAMLVAFAAVWSIARPLARRLGLNVDGARTAVGSAALGFFVLLLLSDLHTATWSAHLLFRAAMIGVMSSCFGAAMYAAHDVVTRRHGHDEWWEAAVHAVPLLLFEIVVFEWVMVYLVDSPASATGIAAAAALAVALAATAALFVSSCGGPLPDRAVASMILFMVALPIGQAALPGRSTAARASGVASTGPKRVILLSIDSLRSDALSAYSPDARPTPALDALANDSVLFERAIAPAPWTLPSMASVLTGLSPAVHLVTGLTARLADEVTTVAESFAGRGYRTAAFVHNPLLEPTRNFAQGFDQYVDLHEPSYGGAVGHRVLQSVLPSAFPRAPWPLTGDHSAAVIDWLDANRDESFFLWVHLFDPHLPYTPAPDRVGGRPPDGLGFTFEGQSEITQGVLRPSAPERRWIRQLYDAEVRDVDANVEGLVATLKRLNLYDESLIVVTSDHGEEFWEHGAQGHGHALHDELLRVPLLVKLPDLSARGRRATPVSTASIAPTLLELAGIQYDAAGMSAPSLGPLLRSDDTGTTNEPVISSVIWSAGPLVDGRDAVFAGGTKYVLARDPAHDLLFDLGADPGEQHPLAAAEPDRVALGRQLLRRHLDSAAALRRRLGVQKGSLTLDENTMRQLRSLGYVQ